ncbi:MAG: hypothetical protein HY716_13740 [Planctomycetes bacterium]|nr:hypothetical protein [Planctomycetota bacterium]
MPPYLAVPHYHLSKLPITTKVALTVFYAALLAALGFSAWPLFMERTGFTTRGVQVNYRGTEFLQERGVIVEREVAAQTERQVYDLVHAHSFVIPVIFFIVCHLMEMCYAAKAFKLALYLLGGASMLGVTFGPLLIHASAGWAVLLIPSMVVMLITFGIMILVPGIQMWMTRRLFPPPSHEDTRR